MPKPMPMPMAVAMVSFCLCACVLAQDIPRACVPPHDGYPFCNSSLPMERRVDDLIQRLTLEEKPSLLIARNSPRGNVSRLGVPEYDWGGNCIHGVQSRCYEDRCPTSYPNPNALGATFNESVWHGMGNVIGIELRALWLQNVGENHPNSSRPKWSGDALPHIGLDCWSPNIGVVRDPRWGRNLETPGEDPMVLGRFGAAVSAGLQQDGTKESIDPRFLQAVVTLKHFDANSLEGTWDGYLTRHNFDAKISQYDLRSLTFQPLSAVREGGAKGHVQLQRHQWSSILRQSCPSHDYLHQEIGFEGYITSTAAPYRISSMHNFTSDYIPSQRRQCRM